MLRSGAAATTASAACGASIGIGLRPSGTGSSLARAISSAGTRPAAAMRSSTRSRALRAASTERSGRRMLRRLRQRHQQRRFGERQPARLLAEIGERGGADAFEIAAIGREAEIEREDLVLAELRARSRSRARSGAAWPRTCARARLEQARDLHGERRGARDDAAVEHELRRPRARAPADRRRDGCGNACPRRRTACRGNADRHPRASPAAASGLPAWCRAAAAGRRDRPPAWSRSAPPRAAPGRARRSTTHGARQRAQRCTADANAANAQCAGHADAERQASRVGEADACADRSRLICAAVTSTCRCRCGRSGRAGTCPRRRPAAARSGRARPPAPRRRP